MAGPASSETSIVESHPMQGNSASVSLLAWAGVAAPLVFVATVVAGGAITPGYSHVADAISELVQAGAPRKGSLDLAFTVYNGLLVAFAVELLRGSRATSSGAIAAGAIATLVMAVAGFLMGPFAMDPIGQPITVTGVVHIVLAGLASLCSLAALFFFAVGLRRVPDGRRWSRYAFVTLFVTFVSGAVAALSAVQLWPTMGLWERVTIGASLQFILVFALGLARGRLGGTGRRSI